ncbi:MAG TPA: TolC family protein [Syntrophomonadaceae bacterium]|nr:TolC family protein [Syntrophomonadaceae bacterium]
MKRKIIITFMILFLMIGNVLPVLAADTTDSSTAPQGLTIQQAIDMALKSSNSLQSASLSVDRSKDVRDYAGYAMGGQMTPTGIGATSSSVSTFYSLVSANISWEMTKKNETAVEDQVSYSTFKAYIDVLNAEETLSLAEKSLAVAQWNNNVASVGWRVGTVGDYDRNSVETAFKAAQKTVEADKIALTGAYQALDKLLGLSADSTPLLAEKPNFVALDPNTNLDGAISNGVDNNPQIYNLDQKVTLAQLSLNTWTGTGDPYEAKEIDKTTAELNAADTRVTLRQAVRTTYNNINSLEQQIAAQQEQLKKDQENLRLTQIKMDIGLATKTDLLSAEFTVQTDTKNLNNNINSHELLKLAFKKPWAVS